VCRWWQLRDKLSSPRASSYTISNGRSWASKCARVACTSTTHAPVAGKGVLVERCTRCGAAWEFTDVVQLRVRRRRYTYRPGLTAVPRHETISVRSDEGGDVLEHWTLTSLLARLGEERRFVYVMYCEPGSGGAANVLKRVVDHPALRSVGRTERWVYGRLALAREELEYLLRRGGLMEARA
jgi:hypothetical protein